MITPNLDAAGIERLETRFREWLDYLDAAQIDELFDAFADLDVTRVEEPRTGLIMITAEDAFAEPFHLGEMLVSTAEVEWDGIRGHATVMGDDFRKAVLAALVSAVCRHDEAAALLESFRLRLAAMGETIEAAQAREAEVIASTRVRFDSMAPETL